MVTFDPTTRHPLPPGVEARGPNLRNGILLIGGLWFDITTETGVPLVPTAACTLTLSVPTHVLTCPCSCHQVESTGYFERWEDTLPPGTDAQKTGRRATHDHPRQKALFPWSASIGRWCKCSSSPTARLPTPFMRLCLGKSIFPVTARASY